MTEEEKTSVTTEEVAQPTESEQKQDVQPAEQQQAQGQSIDDQERNWREARRKMESLERRTQEQEDIIRRMQQQQQPQQVVEDDLAKLSDDDIITAKQARGLAQKMARQVADEAIRQREAATVEERVKMKFSDYDDVVTKDNIEELQKQDPELAASLYALSSDPYSQAVAAYKLLKKTGIGNMKTEHPQKAKAIENARKPVSVQSVTKSSAIGNAYNFENGLTPELKKQLQKEMEQAIKAG
jgi:hypothetical protein